MTIDLPDDEENVGDENVDDDIQNDDVIAAALRKSLIVIVLMGLPVIGVLIYLNVSKSPEEATETDVTLPDVREETATVIPNLPMAEVAAEAGITFVHDSGRAGEKLLPETMGSGVAVLDFNNDGHRDLLFVNSRAWPWSARSGSPSFDDEHSTCHLYAGDGEFGFRDVTEAAGMDISLYGMGVAVGDYDNDGDCDVFLSAVGENRLLRNDDGRFTDVTQAAGVAGDPEAWGTSCGFFDYNNDGLLDLFVCNYVTWSKEADLSQDFTLDGESRAYGPPRAFAGSFSYLYRGDGEGRFTDVSADAGIQIRTDETDVPLGKGMGIVPLDFDQDGWMDIVVANDTVRNFLFRNNRDGTFAEVGQLLGVAYDRATGNARGAMGIDAAVFRDDGTLAIGIGNFANESSALYMARPGRAQFIDAAMFTGFGPPTRAALTFGMFFFDVDLDGRLDVLGANGHLEEEIAKTQSSQTYAQSPQLFWNAGRNSKSELVLVDAGCVGEAFCRPIVGRGAAYGDLDGDGDVDVVISASDSRPVLFRNDQSTGHHYLRINVEGTACNRDGIGAAVTVRSGDRMMTRVVMPTKSYLSQCEKTLTFGLGETAAVDEVTVMWPGGASETFAVESVDQIVTLRQGSGIN